MNATQLDAVLQLKKLLCFIRSYLKQPTLGNGSAKFGEKTVQY